MAPPRSSSGKLDVLELGNLDAKRDWGYAKEYVDGMYRMLQAPEPDTFVLATEPHRNRARLCADGIQGGRTSSLISADPASTKQAVDAEERQDTGPGQSEVLPAGRSRLC